VADDGGDGDIEEEERGDELGYEGSVEGPELNLGEVEERGWWRVHVVLPLLPLFAHFLRHCVVWCGRGRGRIRRNRSRRVWLVWIREEKGMLGINKKRGKRECGVGQGSM